jgi:hypothetical protein
MFPTNNPNPENAMKLTLYFTIQKEEKLNDFITTKIKEPWTEKFQYSTNGYKRNSRN